MASSANDHRDALQRLAQLDKSDVEATLREIVSVSGATLDVARVSYWELLPDHETLRCRVLYERGTVTVGIAELGASHFPAYFRALLACQVIVADDAWTDPRTSEFVDSYFRPLDIRAMLDVPVWCRGRLAGVLCHEHVGSIRFWTPAERDFASAAGNLAQVALEAGNARRAEERFALFARSIDDVLWDWDMRTNTIEWSDAIYTAFGYAPHEVEAGFDWWESRVHADDVAGVKAGIASVIESGGNTWTQQYRFIRRDGSLVTVMDRGHIVRDANGRAVRMVGTMLDISERVELQQRLALSERMASIGTLAAGVAHEINNPLTYIMANVTCALEDVRRGIVDREQLAELLREAQEGAERVRRIVRDLQVFSRPLETEIEVVDVCAVLESTLNMAWNQIKHRARLVRDFAPLPCVRMNRARLGQVVLNLLVNAAQAIDEGDVEGNRICIVTRAGVRGEAIIEVSDTGQGIAPDVIGRIFEPFFTTKAVGEGTGLGLSICHSIVVAAGGRIDVESAPGHGCTMRVTLPGAAPVATIVVAEAPAPPRRRVLVIDDEPHLRRALRRMLEPRHEVVLAEDGEQAFELGTAGSFDVVLCDLMMPRMSGMDYFQKLVETASPLANRIVFMTGGAFSFRSREFLRDCPRPCIEKPLDRRTIERAIADVAA